MVVLICHSDVSSLSALKQQNQAERWFNSGQQVPPQLQSSNSRQRDCIDMHSIPFSHTTLLRFFPYLPSGTFQSASKACVFSYPHGLITWLSVHIKSCMNGEEEYNCPDQCLHQLWRHRNLYVLHSMGCRSLLIIQEWFSPIYTENKTSRITAFWSIHLKSTHKLFSSTKSFFFMVENVFCAISYL